MSKQEEQNKVNFEVALRELEELVRTMEAGDLTLEESLNAFEKGIQLTRQCKSALEKAQLRVTKLMPDESEQTWEEESST